MHISTRSGPGVSNTRVYFSRVIGSTKMITVVAWAAQAEPSNATASTSRNAFMSATPCGRRAVSAPPIERSVNDSSGVDGKWREIGADVVNVDTFAALEPADDRVGDGRQHDFPADLEDELADHHRAERGDGPIGHSVERQRVEDEAVGALADHSAADGPGPQVLALGPDLHLGEHGRIQKIADEERRHRGEDDPPARAEHALVGRLAGPPRGDGQMDDRP